MPPVAEFELSYGKLVDGFSHCHNVEPARGRLSGRQRKMERATLRMAMAAMADQRAVAADVAKRLNPTPYAHVNGDGSRKAASGAG